MTDGDDKGSAAMRGSVDDPATQSPPTFENELRALINRHGMERFSSPCSQPFDSAPITLDAYRKFVGAVMNWISEATGFLHDDVLRTDDARDIITDACSRCWDAFDRIALTDHGASPEARASAESVAPQPTAGDGAGNPPSHSGTGDTPKPHTTPGECSVPLEGTQEPVAWGVAGHKGLLYATAISRMDAVDMQSEHECDTEVVPLYRHPPVTEPMPTEKRAEVCAGPLAWAAIRENGQPLWLSYDRRGAEGMVNGMAEVVPLYRSPTLTDAEREAIIKLRKWASGIAGDNAFIDQVCDAADEAARAMDSLLERHK